MTSPLPQSAAEAKAAILSYVREHDWVSFAALHIEFAGDAREPTEMSLPGNRVVWVGMPKVMIDAVLELLDEELLAAVPGTKAAYRRAGRVLNLPVEKAPPETGHERPHWFPVLLRPIERAREGEP